MNVGKTYQTDHTASFILTLVRWTIYCFCHTLGKNILRQSCVHLANPLPKCK